MKIEICKKRIATLWLVSCGLIYALTIFQTIVKAYPGHEKEVWDWLTPATAPTLLLVIGVFLAEIANQTQDNIKVKPYIFYMTILISAFYLLVIFSIAVVPVLFSLSPIDAMKQSGLFLSVLQGLVAASIGAFFVQRAKS